MEKIVGIGIEQPIDEDRAACMKALAPIVRRLRRQGRPAIAVAAVLAELILATLGRAGLQ